MNTEGAGMELWTVVNLLKVDRRWYMFSVGVYINFSFPHYKQYLGVCSNVADASTCNNIQPFGHIFFGTELHV